MVDIEELFEPGAFGARGLELAAIATLAAIGLIAIVRMIGTALRRDDIIAWTRGELYQAAISIIIIACTAALLAWLNGVVLIIVANVLEGTDFSCTNGVCTFKEYRGNTRAWPLRIDVEVQDKTCTKECHIAIARSRIVSMKDIVLFYMMDKIARASAVETLASVSISLKAVSGITPFGGLMLLVQPYKNMFEIIHAILLYLQFHNVLLATVPILFPLFLISGIVLRTLPFTRRLGGLLIAIAFALYFAYPLLIILRAAVIQPKGEIFPIRFEGLAEWGGLVDEEEVLREFKGLRGVINYVESYAFGPITFGGVIDTTALLAVWLTLQEIILIYAIVLTIREVSPFFGGDVEIAGLSKLL